MSSKRSLEFYDAINEMSPVRSIAELLLNSKKVRTVTAKEAYELAKKQPGVEETDLKIYEKTATRLGLSKGSKVLIDNHGKIIGRTAKARRFYSRSSSADQKRLDGDLREAIFQMQHNNLIKAEAIIGLDKDLMIKATYITTESDANNVFNWLCNFTPFAPMKDEYEKSKKLPIQDIIIVAYNDWRNEDPFYENTGAPQLALVDQNHNVIFNLGMRYFGERKKGTLTLAWTSGMRLGMAASHGGIKEIDFSECSPQYKSLGKRAIAFYGLSGTGKSSHTNSADNEGTMPEGFKKVVLHDDAFQIDTQNKVCRVWEPILFDKTDSRDLDNPEWKYLCSAMNHAMVKYKGKVRPLGEDVRQQNGRALFDRDLLGEWVNKCSFPDALVWLMKDTILPPILKISNKFLGVAMGAALMTKRNAAENIKAEDIGKLVFVPYANPFRVYELYKDVEAFDNVVDNGADCYVFNSAGYWKNSDTDVENINLKTSLTLQTGILTDKLEWEEWDSLSGAMIPTKESIEKILPGYYDKYDPKKRGNLSQYKALVRDRFQQRIDFLQNSDVKERPELLKNLLESLKINK